MVNNYFYYKEKKKIQTLLLRPASQLPNIINGVDKETN